MPGGLYVWGVWERINGLGGVSVSVEILRPTIEIQMLGEFAITINGNTITNLKGRTKRVWMLIEYLIANRHSDISIEKLIDVLWGEDECGDPVNALKNLVYRARTCLLYTSRCV